MSIRKTITLTSVLALTAVALSAPSAGAYATRELVTSFGSFEPGLEGFGVSGLAVDLETGNVYVADNQTQTIDIFGPTGGSPIGGAPLQITGLQMYKRGPSGVAVDNSCYEHQPRLTGKACEEYDPSYGDVYVINRGSAYNGAGIEKFKLNPGKGYELVEKINHAEGAGNTGPQGLAVDSHGNVYANAIHPEEVTLRPGPVVEFRKVVERVVNGGVEEFQEKLEEIRLPQHIVPEADYVAVDGQGDIYVGSEVEDGGVSEGYKGVAKLRVGGSGNVLSEEVLAGPIEHQAHRAVAVDSVTGAVFVGDVSSVAEYSSAGVLQLSFGSTEALGGSLGTYANGLIAIAVNGESELVYVANPLHHDVDVFGPAPAPPVVENPQPTASDVTRTSAFIAGTANPESKQANYYFEYVAGEEYEPAAADPYSAGGRTAVEALSGGHTPQTVERIVLTGLRPGVTYHYRMVVTNAAQTTYGPDQTFTTAPAIPPTVLTGVASEVAATSATLSGMVGPRGLPTSYVFEVGTSTGYEGAKLFGNAGSSTGEVPVTVGLQYLVPGVTYHYRLVATSFDGTSYGQDGSFTTPGVPASIAQPASTPLIASPSVQFPSTAGAITQPQGTTKKALTRAQKLTKALKACRRKSKSRRAGCEMQARKQYGKTK